MVQALCTGAITSLLYWCDFVARPCWTSALVRRRIAWRVSTREACSSHGRDVRRSHKLEQQLCQLGWLREHRVVPCREQLLDPEPTPLRALSSFCKPRCLCALNKCLQQRLALVFSEAHGLCERLERLVSQPSAHPGAVTCVGNSEH